MQRSFTNRTFIKRFDEDTKDLKMGIDIDSWSVLSTLHATTLHATGRHLHSTKKYDTTSASPSQILLPTALLLMGPSADTQNPRCLHVLLVSTSADRGNCCTAYPSHGASSVTLHVHCHLPHQCMTSGWLQCRQSVVGRECLASGAAGIHCSISTAPTSPAAAEENIAVRS